ncbi:ubiquinol oxidase subunit II [Pseudaeromonas sharmana]|uniref:Ubiquinol oxidase subunit 2 n=1 Tax=Pseudaeromonas sharmana TaxID=328412 RepID=A0ABV8CKX9_9GAMM
MRGKQSKLRAWMLALAPLLLTGCDMALLDPKGEVGLEQRSLILTALGLMLIVVIPVFIMTIWFAWRYRASNKEATYKPEWSHSNLIEAVVWGVPCIIIIILGILTWRTTHSLDPRHPLTSDAKPMVIQAVSLDWKWLFIYPEQGIATVNHITFPANVPIHFEVTSGSVMNSFFIPQLGSQIYAMAGMRNHLNLIANHEGVYKGISANYSGHGFSGMKFSAEAVSPEAFDAWINQARQSPLTLKMADYQTLAKPTQNHAVTYYGTVEGKLYDSIVAQFMSHGTPASGAEPMHDGHDMMHHDSGMNDMHAQHASGE